MVSTKEPLAHRAALSRRQRAELEARLLAERRQAQEALNRALEEESEPQSDSSGDVARHPSHMAEAGSQSDEADTDFQVAQRNSERVACIDEALIRLRDAPAAAGVCRTCGATISMTRLRLVPWTLVCARHAEEPS